MPRTDLTAAHDPYKRHKTRHRGISYRLRVDGSRSYAVYNAGRYVAVHGGERGALTKQAELRRAAGRGERVIVNSRITFSELAEEWLKSKRRLRPWTRSCYRSALDNVLLPRFGSWRVSAIDASAVADLIRDLEAKGLNAIDSERRVRPLSASTIANYILPLQGVLTLAVRRGLIGTNPCSILTPDERPAKRPKRATVEWSDEQIALLVKAAEEHAGKPESRFNYAPIIAIAAKTGLRLGELLGLQWGDVDLEEGVIRVERQLGRTGELVEPKTPQAVRRVPISPDVCARLRRLKLASRFSRDEHPVFASRSGTPLSHRNVQRRGFDVLPVRVDRLGRDVL